MVGFCGLCNAVDDRTGFRTINRVNQFPGMFVQAETPERFLMVQAVTDVYDTLKLPEKNVRIP